MWFDVPVWACIREHILHFCMRANTHPCAFMCVCTLNTVTFQKPCLHLMTLSKPAHCRGCVFVIFHMFRLRRRVTRIPLSPLRSTCLKPSRHAPSRVWQIACAAGLISCVHKKKGILQIRCDGIEMRKLAVQNRTGYAFHKKRRN